MKKRPLLLLFSSALLFIFPMEWLLRYKMGQAFYPVDFFLSFICPWILMVGLLRVQKVGWYTLIAFVSIFGLRDLYAFYINETSSSLPFFIHLGVYLFSLIYFIHPRIRQLYFDPKLQWWRTKERYETHVPFILSFEKNFQYPILTNISEEGCFIETHHNWEPEAKFGLTIPLPFAVQQSVIKTEGQVKWISKNPLRPGVGVQFLSCEGKTRKAVREFVKRIG